MRVCICAYVYVCIWSMWLTPMHMSVQMCVCMYCIVCRYIYMHAHVWLYVCAVLGRGPANHEI